jgi:hypothetical protein
VIRLELISGGASGAQQRTGQTRWTAAAVDAEFAAGEGAEVESVFTQASVRVAFFFEGEQAIVAEGQDIAGQGFALGGIDFDEPESARS